MLVRNYSRTFKRKVQSSDGWHWNWRKSENDLVYVTEDTPFLKILVWGTYSSWTSWESKETKDITIEQAIRKVILYVIKKIDKLKIERLEKERQYKIREYRQRQVKAYNNFLEEQKIYDKNI